MRYLLWTVYCALHIPLAILTVIDLAYEATIGNLGYNIAWLLDRIEMELDQ